MLTRLASALVALTLACPMAAAQTATFTAVIEPAGISFCMEESHVVTCNGGRLRSLVLGL